MQRTPDCLSDEAFAKEAVEIEVFAEVLRAELDDQAVPVVEAIRADGDHELRGEATELLWDAFTNGSDALAEFTADGSFGEYPVVVKGISPLCIVWAPEFDKVGPFPSVKAAEAYLMREWSDSLVRVVSDSHPRQDFSASFPQGRPPVR